MDVKEEIRSRMLRDVARLWGYQDTEMDEKAFDPVVGLLVGACATEFAKIQQELEHSRGRILEQLVNTLTPDVLMAPLPAHSVMHVRALEPITLIAPHHQVYYTKTVGEADKEIYFSTPAAYRLINGGVRYLVAAGKVYDVLSEMPRREKLLESDSFRRTWPTPTLWLGLELDGAIDTVDGLSFFFNWKNEPRLRAFLRQLPFCRWYLGEREIAVEKGIRESSPPGRRRDMASSLEAEFSPAWRIKNRATTFYQDHFVTLNDPASKSAPQLANQKKQYPEAFEMMFPREDLTALKEKLLWIRVDFPEFFPIEALVQTECQINCVPVLNKRFHEETYRLQEMVNILPIHCDDFFFDVHSVMNEQDQELSAHPLASLRNLETGSYTLRARSAGKMDGRAASQELYHLIDLLRDESAAFAAFDLNTLNEKIKNLNKEITALEQHLQEVDTQREELPYLIVKMPHQTTRRNQSVRVEFWSTAGELANDIPGGLKLDMYATKGFNRGSIQLMLSTLGGANRKSASDAFYDFKKSLTTRDRVVSGEDIKTFCFATLGRRLARVRLQKGVFISEEPQKGMTRTLEVWVSPAAQLSPQELQEWNAQCYELETELNAKSAGLLPIRVLTDDAS